MTKPTSYDRDGHWALVICWSLGFGHWSFSNVVHLLQRPRAAHVLEQLLEREVVQGRVGGFGELFIEQVDRHLPRRAVVHPRRLLHAEPPFQPADDVADADVRRRTRQAVAPLAADLALEEPPPPQGEQNGFQELVGQ